MIIEVNPNKAELPTEAYIAVEEIREDGTPVRESFEHIPCSMGAEEAEEVGVEHLLRLVTFEASFFYIAYNWIFSHWSSIAVHVHILTSLLIVQLIVDGSVFFPLELTFFFASVFILL